MGFFEDAVERAKSAAQTAGQKASEAVPVEKLKINLSKAESELKKRYEQLGELTYEARRDGCGREAECAAKMDEIAQWQQQIAVLKKQIAEG